MEEFLKWVEQAAAENMKFRAQNAEQLTKDANTLLTVLLAGIGGALALIVKSFEGPTHPPMPILVGTSALSVWFMALALLTLHYCIRTAPFPAPTNEPKNLHRPDIDFSVLRKLELDNLQIRIEEVTERNYRYAIRLDRIRYACAAAPLIFIVAAAASAHWPALFSLALVAG